MSMLGTTAGAHRLWAHRSYKARLPLRILLGILQTMAFQVNQPSHFSVYEQQNPISEKSGLYMALYVQSVNVD